MIMLSSWAERLSSAELKDLLLRSSLLLPALPTCIIPSKLN